MTEPETLKFSLKRRSSSHSAYWMSNALIPAGVIMMYQYGWAVESVLGILFIGIGAVGYCIYKQKMSIPIIKHVGDSLIYSPSDELPSSIKMDSSSKIIVSELYFSVESAESPDTQIRVSRLDFNSNEDWQLLIDYLRQDHGLNLFFEY